MIRRYVCVVLSLFGMVAAPLRAEAGGANPAPLSAAVCAANPWIDVRCFGATGNGATDDTGAVNRALAAALSADEPLFLPHGRYKLTRTLVIDYKARADTGFRLISMGAVLDGNTISSEPVLEIHCSGGTVSRQRDVFISTSKEPCSSMPTATAMRSLSEKVTLPTRKTR